MTNEKNVDNVANVQNDGFFPSLDNGVENAEQAEFVVDFSSVDENASFEALPVGVYNAVISAMEVRKSKNNNPMLSVTFSVVHEDFNNRKLFTHFVLNNDIALGRLKKFLINIFPDLDLSQLDLNALCASGTGLNRPVTLKVSQRPYEGRMTNDVKEVMAPSSDSLFC